jgi:sacsin
LEISREAVFRHVLPPDRANDLPVWPRISSQHGYLTAREAIAAQNSAFVVPWIKDYHLFTEINRFHQSDSINDAELLRSHVLPALPDFIDGENKARYCQLVRAIAHSSSLKERISKRNPNRRFVVPLNTHRLAARQDGTLCLASDLFDHNDTIFSAAFRFEGTTRFLMLEARIHISLWHELGIRRRQYGQFSGADYLSCLHALERRLAGVRDQELAKDIETVLYPLCASDASLSGLDYTTWSTIASLPVFPVSPVSDREPGYRRPQMESLASRKHTMSLKEIVRREFASLCWSQTPFVLHEPSGDSFEQVYSKGQPSCVTVWQHLAFLAELAQSIDEAEVERFVDDLQRTYDFLRLNLQASKSTFSEPRAAIWLNAEATTANAISLDVLKSSWTSLENLLLDSPCDAPPLMTVQPFLGRFSTLLKEIGCKSLYYPPITLPSADRAQTTFDSVRELWKDRILTDVMFKAEGITISAHKIILASRSLYCKTQFSGSWAVLLNRNDTNKVIELKDMTYATLQIMIEFCYNETHDWAVRMQVKEDDCLLIIAEKLDCLFDVLAAADRWLMPDLHADAQRHILFGARYFIRPDNVEHVLKVASDSRAPELKDYCQKYSDRNPEAVLLAS